MHIIDCGALTIKKKVYTNSKLILVFFLVHKQINKHR